MTDQPNIDLRDVSYGVDGMTSLKGITLRTTERRIGVVGRNGSGKTTLGRALCGLIDVTGRLRVADVDPARDRRAALGAVGLLFQNPDHQIIFPTVSEELAFGLRQQGLPKADAAQRVTRTLAQFDRTSWHDRATNDLSHGQKQLVCLMAILAMRPSVIVLDEPFAGLDLPLRLRLHRILAGLDATLVHISHNPDDLRDCDRIVWLDRGRIARDGGPDTLDAYVTEMHRLADDPCSP